MEALSRSSTGRKGTIAHLRTWWGSPPLDPQDVLEHSVLLRSSNPQLRRGLRLVASHTLDEPLRVLATYERLDGVAERMVRRGAQVDDGVDDQRRDDTATR